jgi:hypothetical protein
MSFYLGDCVFMSGSDESKSSVESTKPQNNVQTTTSDSFEVVAQTHNR